MPNPIISQEPEPPGSADVRGIVNVDAVANRLSRERLTKYIARTGGSVPQALDLYLWNREIGMALNVVLAEFEVCLRNSVSMALSDKATADRHGPDWHTHRRLKHNNRDITREFEDTYERARQNRNGFAPALPDFIAASHFNLWRELCKPAYGGVFWAKRVRLSFPHVTLPGDERSILTEVHRRVDLLLKLRNRIAHHEPLLGPIYDKPGEKLRLRHREMIGLLEWMDPNFAHWVASRDRFEAVMAACPR
ncbi:MAG TPA: hypothetical protein VGN83_06200 [Falsiroseomonas sp.]|jgi:hypothetical protein|nr:hypothetical protein [Falsiroseomonas sp.]